MLGERWPNQGSVQHVAEPVLTNLQAFGDNSLLLFENLFHGSISQL